MGDADDAPIVDTSAVSANTNMEASDMALETPSATGRGRGPGISERLLAAAAHLLMFFSLPGLLVAALIWLTQRRRSAYIAHQAREAVVWQILSNVIFLMLVVALVITALLSLGGTVGTHGTTGQIAFTSLFGSLLGLYIVLIVGAAFFIGSSVLGAISALLGKHFRYPLVGRKPRPRT